MTADELLTALLRAFHPRHSRRASKPGDAINEAAQRIKKAIPYTVSKRLVELFTSGPARRSSA